ncbi:MAG: hypothetical protein HOP34_11975 [Methylococcaceae bacterium]|nr:hypothetical protein [Methylococcaceae bacterium]
MLIKLTGAKVYDPASGIDGQQQDIYIQDGRIVDKPSGEFLVPKLCLGTRKCCAEALLW